MVARTLLALASAAAALALAAPASASQHAPEIDRGVVQSVSAGQIVLRELDGSTHALGVASTTRVRLNGFPAALADVEPGFVAAVTHQGDATATLIRAFGRVQLETTRGIVLSVSAQALSIRTLTGEETFRLTARTRVVVRGLPAPLSTLRPGRLVAVLHTHAGEARRIAVRARLLLR